MLKRFSNGNHLLAFIDCDPPAVPADDTDTPLTWAMVVLHKEGRFLLQHNFNRAQWECAAGGIEAGETVAQAAMREVMEETSQQVVDLRCRGVFKLWLAAHHRSEYGALYTGTFADLRPFIVNNESDRLTLWQPGDPLDDRMSELSAWMIEYAARLMAADSAR